MILLPSRPKIVEKKDENQVIFEIDSLYPGYGVTIGNSLRRTLLSSLGGSAVTKVKIEGVNHEFSTMEGVVEDVITIILNLKELRFHAHAEGEHTAVLKIKGEKEIKGSDLKLPTQLELANKDAHIATITSKHTELDMEISIESGMGYSSAEERKEDKLEVGQIMVDAIFTPIKRVNFHVENMRVGKRTDFDRLFVEIETDRTLSPEDAFRQAVKILSDHYSQLSYFEGEDVPAEDVVKKPAKESKKAEKKEEVATDEITIEEMSIEELGLSRRTSNRLKESGIKKIKGIIMKREEDVADLEGMGVKGMEEIKKALKNNNLSFKK